MTILINWPDTLAAAAGILVLLGYALLRRGARGAGQAGIAVSAWRLIAGALTGSFIGIGAGLIVLAASVVCLWCTRGPAGPQERRPG